MAYQFAHIETYSNKKNKNGVDIKFIFDENSRRNPSATTHIENPKEPTLVYGMPINDLEILHDNLFKNTKTTNVNGHTRGLRKDQHTLFTIVLSHPSETNVDDNDDIASVQEWEYMSLKWLENKYGNKLKTVVRHDDEAHPHLHCLILNDDENSHLMAKNLHPGVVAKNTFMKSDEAKQLDSKHANKLGDKAYKNAMREWQDDYFKKVGLACGLNRLGPKKRRLTRAEYNLEKQSTQMFRKVNKAVHQYKQELKTIKINLKNTKIQYQKYDKVQSFTGAIATSWNNITENIRNNNFKKGVQSTQIDIDNLNEIISEKDKIIENIKLESENNFNKYIDNRKENSSLYNENNILKESLNKLENDNKILKENELIIENTMNNIADNLHKQQINPAPIFKDIHENSNVDFIKNISKKIYDKYVKIYNTVKNSMNINNW